MLGFLTAGVLITGTAIFIRPILMLLNVPPQQLDMALSYITLLVWGMFVTLAYNLCANTLRAIGDSITPLIFLVIAAVANVVLDYLFILVFHMGVRGRRGGDTCFADAVGCALPASHPAGISDAAPCKGAFCAFKRAGSFLI